MNRSAESGRTRCRTHPTQILSQFLQTQPVVVLASGESNANRNVYIHGDDVENRFGRTQTFLED